MKSSRTILLVGALALAACGNDATPAGSGASTSALAGTSTALASTTSVPASTTTEPEVVLPTGILFVVPTQNREDPAKGQFQAQFHNDTGDRFDLAEVQFVWDGYTTPVTERTAVIVGGQTVDMPVKFPGATCVGDGTIDTMPSVDSAQVKVRLADGSQLQVPVVDQFHLARKLYLEDCERQMLESAVGVEWVDLHEEEFEGRPVTAGSLRLTRRTGEGTITVLSVSNTIPFEFVAVDTAVDEPVVVLEDGADEVSVPVRFLESRCDPHALAEIKQPTKFISQVQLGDGAVHPYIIYPERSYWNVMRATADKACVLLGKVENLGGA